MNYYKEFYELQKQYDKLREDYYINRGILPNTIVEKEMDEILDKMEVCERYIKIEKVLSRNDLSQWIDLDYDTPIVTPVVYLTVNQKIMVINRPYDLWLREKYGLRYFIYPPKYPDKL